MKNNTSPSLVSLFSGAGCFDLGFEAAGFKTLLTTDIDFDCCQTIRLNRDWNNIHGPIEEISSKHIMSHANIRRKELDLLIGGPPCQPYSKSSFGTVKVPLGHEDHRASTVNEYVRVVRDTLPKVFIIENVPQFISGKNIKMKNYLERSISKINRENGTKYKLTYHQLNAAAFGVPQIRERLFIVAARNGKIFQTPEPKFFAKADAELQMKAYITARDAIGHLAAKHRNSESLELNGHWQTLLKSIPPGSNYLWHSERGGGKKIFKWRSRFWNFLLKLHPDQPSWTIAAQPGHHTGPFHWDSRRLTTLERQILQTIPANYIFYGGKSSINKQIGNGVPSAIGEMLGREIRNQLLGHNCNTTNLSLVPKAKRRRNELVVDL